MAAGAVGAAQQHQVAGAAGVPRRAHHKGAAERLDQRRHKGVLPQHLRFDFIRCTAKIRVHGLVRVFRFGSRRGGGAAQQPVLMQRSRQLAAHFPHALGGGSARFLHSIQRRACRTLPLLGRGQRVQACLHLLHGVAGLLGLFRRSGVFFTAHQAAHPGIVLIFQAHWSSSRSALWGSLYV